MKKLLLAFVLSTAAFSAGCYIDDTYRPANGDYYGSAYYDVSEVEYITDGYGYSQTAYCANDPGYPVEFTGWFDADCDALISSEPRYADLRCDYYDVYGYPHYYYDSFFFPRGYIAEYCSYGKAASSLSSGSQTDDTTGAPKFDSTTQPVLKDTVLRAIVANRVGPRLVEQNLGKNVSVDEVMTAKGSLKRVRSADKPIEKIVTEQEAATK